MNKQEGAERWRVFFVLTETAQRGEANAVCKVHLRLSCWKKGRAFAVLLPQRELKRQGYFIYVQAPAGI